MSANSEQSLAETPDKPSLTGSEGQWSRAVRGKYYERQQRRSNVVTIDSDLREHFPSERAVNDALRTLIPLVRRDNAQRQKSPRFPRQERETVQDYDQPKRTVVIHDDVSEHFVNKQRVNEALRVALKLHVQLEARTP